MEDKKPVYNGEEEEQKYKENKPIYNGEVDREETYDVPIFNGGL